MPTTSHADAQIALKPWVMLALATVAGGLLLFTQPINQALFKALNHGLAATPHALWAGLTVLGFGWPIAILVLAADRRSGIGPAWLAPCVALTTLFTRVPRGLWYSPRPLAALPHDQVVLIGRPVIHASSMPSGHSMAAFAGACLLWFIWSRVRRSSAPRAERALHRLPLLLGFGVSVGLSRIAVGAHWPADVLVGGGLGILAATLAVAIERRTSWAPWFARPAQQRGVAFFELGCALIWALTDNGYPEGDWAKWLVVAVGGASGALRWYVTRHPRSVPPHEVVSGH